MLNFISFNLSCEPKPTLEQNYTEINNLQTQLIVPNIIKAAVYPNPANESFSIYLPKNLSGFANIMDLTGKVLKTFNLTNGENTVRHDLPKGIYIVKIQTNDGLSLTEKLSIIY